MDILQNFQFRCFRTAVSLSNCHMDRDTAQILAVQERLENLDSSLQFVTLFNCLISIFTIHFTVLPRISNIELFLEIIILSRLLNASSEPDLES